MINSPIVPSKAKRPKIVVVIGPTSAGKTALSIALAKTVDGEIISADSRQVYRGLNLGSGKVTEKEMDGVPHYLLDVADSKNVFTASDFVELGKQALMEIHKKNKVPIIAGGTGFYIDALLEKISLAEVAPNESLRKELETSSKGELQAMLKELDPERYTTIDTQNPRRLIRAIEIAQALGKNPGPATDSPYNILWIGLMLPQDELKKKIHDRLALRFDQGMLEEAKQLYAQGLSYERMEQLGLEYRYMARFLNEEIAHDEMVAQLEFETVKYAKRQMTWFKKNTEIKWFPPDEIEKVIELTKKFLK